MTGRFHSAKGFVMPGSSAETRVEVPGATSYRGGMRAPEGNSGAKPRVSDYAVEPETRQEMFRGEVREALPAGPKHSRQHAQVDFVLGAYVAPGYGTDTDLLTRQASGYNFASDTSVRKNGIDPATGDRYLEELAFEIKATQSAENLEHRARVMAERGVRRIFAIPVYGDAAGMEIIAGPFAEWVPAEGCWRTYSDEDVITDPCLFAPLPVRALLDAVEADDAVAQALLDKGNSVLVSYGDARAEEQTRKILQLLLRDRGIFLDAAAHARIAECSDMALLERWAVRAALVGSQSELFDDA
jgi:hypothetical protein